MKTRFALIAAASLICGAALAQAPHGGPPGPDIDRMAILLDLDAAQKADVQKILDEQHAKMRAAHEANRNSGERPSREEMQKQHEQMKQEVKAKLANVLTAEQLKKFDALMSGPPGPPHRGPRN